MTAPPRDPALERAYAHSRRIIREKAHSFAFAARFLPRERRRDVYALYAFCRTVDDIADLAGRDASARDAQSRLDRWREWLGAGAPRDGDPIKYGLAHVMRTYNLPLAPFLDLLDGLCEDLEPRHLPDGASLERYCYRVAGTVGILMATLLGARDPRAYDHARDLGIAMQLTNMLRDVGEDLARGRIYLPADEMARHSYLPSDLERGIVDERLVALLRGYIEWARRSYRQGLIGLRFLPRPHRLPIVIAAHTYAGILCKIEQAGYDVFTHRAHTSRRDKLLLMARLSLRPDALRAWTWDPTGFSRRRPCHDRSRSGGTTPHEPS